MLPEVSNLIERYDQSLKDEEDTTIQNVNTALDTGFDRLMRRVNSLLRDREGADTPSLEAQAARARQLSSLLIERNPQKADVYQRAYERLAERSSTLGLDHTTDTLRLTAPDVQLQTVDIPIEAIQQAGTRSRSYLQRYGDDFANKTTAEVQAALVEGTDFPTLTNRLQQKLGVTKMRADTLTRTESLNAFNSAAEKSMLKHGVKMGVWYATKDERTCPVCAYRHGSIYELGNAKIPCHPRCRCRLAAITEEALGSLNIQKDLRRSFKEVRGNVVNIGGSLDSGAAPFEDRAPQALWSPRDRSNKLRPYTK